MTKFLSRRHWPQPNWATPRVILLGLLILAFYLRVSELATAPPGLHYDEAAHGLDALRVWEGRLKLFFPTANGHEPLFTYTVALFVRFLGNTILAIRLPAAFWGTLAVATCYALGKRLLGPWQAVLASALLAVTFWTVALSRMGLRANTLLAIFPLWLLAYWACRHSTDWRRYLLAGILLGAAQYTYTAARFMPLLALILAVDWRHTLSKRGLGVGALAAFAVTAPLLFVLLADPEVGSMRLRQVWLFSREEPLALLWDQIQKHLLMFGVTGDPIWTHNLPDRPPVLSLVASFGWLAILIDWRQPATRTLLLASAVMLWPGILAVSNVAVPPDHLRVIEVAPLAFLLAAAGLHLLSHRHRLFAPLLACALVLIDGGLSWRDYQRWLNARETYEQLDADMSVLAQDILAQPDTLFLIPLSAAWQEFEPGHHWTIDYLTNFRSNYYVVPAPYTLPPLTAERVNLVHWLAGMHLNADPQHTLAGQLALRGYAENDGDTRTTYGFDRYVLGNDAVTVVPLEPQLHFVEGLTITEVTFYLQAASDAARTLTAEVRWQSRGPQTAPLSISLRLAQVDGAAGAQVDSWLWNDQGETAESWQSQEESRLFLEVDAAELPAGRYQVTLIPYQTATQQPLQPQHPPDQNRVGVIELP